MSKPSNCGTRALSISLKKLFVFFILGCVIVFDSTCTWINGQVTLLQRCRLMTQNPGASSLDQVENKANPK